MAEAQNVPVVGGNIPPIPAQSQPSNLPPQGMQPGFVNPDAPQGITQAQVDAQIAAALAAAKPAPATPVPSPVPDFAANAPADPVLASLTDVFVKVGNGLDLDRAIGKALQYGDPALIDKAYITEKGGATATQLATLAEAIVTRVQTQTSEAVNSVYSTAGDKASWDAAAAVFNQQAPAHLKMVIAQMLESGNPQAVKAAAQSVVDYTRNNGLVSAPGQYVNAGATGASAAQALDKEGFQEALRSLDRNSRTYETQRQDLFVRRALGKQLGK